MAGISQGPTPWWQIGGPGPNGGAAQLANLSSSAPSGYSYDPVSMSYVRTPQSAGQNIGTLANSALGAILGSGSSLNPGGGGIAGLTAAAASSLPGGFGGGNVDTTSVGGAGTPGVVASGSYVPGVAPIDMSGAESAAFSKAKDTAGQAGRASLDALRSEMAASGLAGSGQESAGIEKIGESALGQLGDVARSNATNEVNTNLDVAKTNASNAITQRGQDIAAQEANANLAMQQNALKVNSSLDMLRLALGLIPSVSASGGGSSVSLY